MQSPYIFVCADCGCWVNVQCTFFFWVFNNMQLHNFCSIVQFGCEVGQPVFLNIALTLRGVCLKNEVYSVEFRQKHRCD